MCALPLGRRAQRPEAAAAAVVTAAVAAAAALRLPEDSKAYPALRLKKCQALHARHNERTLIMLRRRQSGATAARAWHRSRWEAAAGGSAGVRKKYQIAGFKKTVRRDLLDTRDRVVLPIRCTWKYTAALPRPGHSLRPPFHQCRGRRLPSWAWEPHAREALWAPCTCGARHAVEHVL